MVKKKAKEITDEILSVYNDERLVSKKDKEQLAKKSKEVWPKVVVGSHLTVTTHEDGRTELEWDHDALMRDVLEAIASVEPKKLKPAVKAKAVVARKKKEKAKDGK